MSASTSWKPDLRTQLLLQVQGRMLQTPPLQLSGPKRKPLSLHGLPLLAMARLLLRKRSASSCGASLRRHRRKLSNCKDGFGAGMWLSELSELPPSWKLFVTRRHKSRRYVRS
jgi:hypothetical protein